MSTAWSIIVLAALAALVLAGMLLGWRGRTRRTGAAVLTLPVTPPEGTGDGTLGAARSEPIEATYVSSTRAGDWLDRVTAHGLGVRSRAVVQVFDAGVVVARTGAPDVFVPAASLVSAETAAGIAGKVTGGEGILVLRWTTGPDDERGLDTGLRVRHAADRPVLLAAATSLRTDPRAVDAPRPGPTALATEIAARPALKETP